MAVLRSLLLRNRATTLSLLRPRSLSSISTAAAIPSSSLNSAAKLPAFSHSPPWKGILVRRFGSASPAEAEIVSEGISSPEQSEAVDKRHRESNIDELEGCDFNHWLIVVDFAKDPKPSADEMIRFYEQTCATTLNLSLEEAKKKIYATSTSNYTGFHVQVTETESEKFNGQPGVVFVLPDSYSDDEKKEYGGDKYINGVIIPRPRPTKRRYWDVPPKQRGPVPDQQGSSPNGQAWSVQETRSPNLQEQTATPSSQDAWPQQTNQQRIYPPYTHQGLTQGPGRTNWAPPTYQAPSPPIQQNYYVSPGQGVANPPRTPYHQGSTGFVPYEGSYTQGWTWNYAPPPPPQGFYSGPPPPQAAAYYVQGVSYSGYHGHHEANWYRGNMQGQCYSSPAWYNQQPHGPPRQHNWQGQPYSGHVGPGYHAPPPNQAQGYATPVQYERQQQDNGYQGQGHQMGYWEGPNNYTNSKG